MTAPLLPTLGQKCVSWVELFGFQANKRNKELEAAIAEHKRTHDGDDYFGFFGFFDDILRSNNKALTMDEFMLGKNISSIIRA